MILFGKKLPISFTEKRISENKYCQKVYDKEETDSMIMQKIFFYEKNFLQDKKILDRKIEKSENETEVIYNVTYSIEGKIGTQQDIQSRCTNKKIVDYFDFICYNDINIINFRR